MMNYFSARGCRVAGYLHFLLFKSAHGIARGSTNPQLIDQSSHFEIRTDLYFVPLLARSLGEKAT